ncbi:MULTISPECIES: hypothetical protein [unclassified Mesorhizobium]|uniref:hypothetical protein n=1 Tax=unclassified Mesorhizobium TaxID=325217 RepID=UPI0024178E5D|nr:MULTISPECIES: hypothetical protein [unclassified Mesorhizobium]WFP66239.1 hypothetical protein QAZ47_14550 [Mesorhizobium sp. WSM4904]WFP79517.1 hypothetical protein QAZ22_14485 [Mesorhizobium sp. WSM4906]
MPLATNQTDKILLVGSYLVFSIEVDGMVDPSLQIANDRPRLLFRDHFNAPMKTVATFDSAAGTFTLEKDIWRGTFPIADLPKWLNFYRQQMQRYPAHAANYAPDMEALEALAAELHARQ